MRNSKQLIEIISQQKDDRFCLSNIIDDPSPTPRFKELAGMPHSELLETLARDTILFIQDVLEEREISMADWNGAQPLFTELEDESAIPRLFAAFLWASMMAGRAPDYILPWISNLPHLKVVPEEGDIGGVTYEELKKFAMRALSHPKVQATTVRIVELASMPLFVAITAQIEVRDIVFFTFDYDTSLFGFSGLDVVYINVSAFSRLVDSKSAGLQRFLPTAVKLAFASVLIQENARIKMRKSKDDPMHYGPGGLKEKYGYVKPSLLDPGVLSEIFAYDTWGVPAWLMCSALQGDLLSQFLSAFENHTAFPRIPGGGVPDYEFKSGMYKVLVSYFG